MANEPFGETVGTKIARLEEKQDAMCEKQDTLLVKMDTLIDHVNHQNEKVDVRLCACESELKEKEAERKGQIKIYKIATAILALITSGLTIAHFFGYI